MCIKAELNCRFTRTGVAMRATAGDQATAFAMGIDIRRVFSNSWSLAAVTVAVAGIVIGTIGTRRRSESRNSRAALDPALTRASRDQRRYE